MCLARHVMTAHGSGVRLSKWEHRLARACALIGPDRCVTRGDRCGRVLAAIPVARQTLDSVHWASITLTASQLHNTAMCSGITSSGQLPSMDLLPNCSADGNDCFPWDYFCTNTGVNVSTCKSWRVYRMPPISQTVLRYFRASLGQVSLSMTESKLPPPAECWCPLWWGNYSWHFIRQLYQAV